MAPVQRSYRCDCSGSVHCPYGGIFAERSGTGSTRGSSQHGRRNTDDHLEVLLAEARTSLLVGVTIAVGTILGYSAMAGTVGGGGLGDIAIRYGYYRYQTDIMIITIVILVVLVQILQGLGMMLSRKLDKRKA